MRAIHCKALASASLVLVLACLACTAGDGTAPKPQEDAAPAVGEAEPPRIGRKALRVPTLAEATPAPDPQVVLFLPFLNRSEHRLHPGYLAAFDRALAAYAAAMLGLRPVRPEVAGWMAAELGVLNARWKSSRATPAPEALARVAERSGAGTIVWGEIRAGGSLALHATAHVAGADAGIWDGIELPLAGELDAAMYDAPRRLLAQLAASGRIPAVGSGSQPDAAAVQRLEAAIDLARFGHPLSVRRAERELAKLAVAHPHWSTPWVRLAWLRSVRGLLLRNAGGLESGFLNEGPSAARHVARLFPSLPPDEAALLDAVDHVQLAHVATPEQLAALVARAPGEARLLLAHRHPTLSRDVFRLASIEPVSDFERSVLELAKAEGNAGRAKRVVALAESLSPGEALLQPYLAHAMDREMGERGRWTEEYRWSMVAVHAHALAVLELLRDRCATLGTEAVSCAAAVRELAAHYLPEDEAARLDPGEVDSWDERTSRLLMTALQTDPVASRADALPDREVFLDDRRFAVVWLLASDLVDAANGTFAAHDDAAAPATAPEEPLLADTRDLLRDQLAWILETAYQPARIGMERGQRDEAEPYMEALEPFTGDFPVARHWNLELRSAFGLRGWYTRDRAFLAEYDLYDARWSSDWLGGIEREEPEKLPKLARLMSEVVPYTHRLAQAAAEAWWKADEVERAIEVLERRMTPMPDGSVAHYLDRARESADWTEEQRLPDLEAATARFPYVGGLAHRLAHIHLDRGRMQQAEALLRPLLENDPKFFREGCWDIAFAITFRTGDAQAVQAHYASCLEHAADKWDRAHTYYELAGLAVQQGDHAAAMRALEQGTALIGGAGNLLWAKALVYELSGDHEQAEAVARQFTRIYPRSDSGRNARARLHLRRNEVAAARAALLEAELDPAKNKLGYKVLGYVHLRENSFADFEKRVQDEFDDESYEALLELYLELGDFERELALVEAAVVAFPGWQREAQRGRALVDAGRFAEARGVLEPLFEGRQRNNWLRLHLVRAYVGLGELARARALTDEWTLLEPYSRDGAEMRHRVALAAKDRARARAELKKTAAFPPMRGSLAYTDWYQWQARWLVLEAEMGLDDASPADLSRIEEGAELVLHRFPERVDLWPVLARVREARGDTPGASEAWTQAALRVPGRYADRVAQAHR